MCSDTGTSSASQTEMGSRLISIFLKTRRSERQFCVLLIACAPLSAQVLMSPSGPGGMVRLFSSDAAILEAGETRKDIPCTVTPIKPLLGFDLKFHAGYD